MTTDPFKVDFFCVGVAKAGTTTLHDLLCAQDGVALPRRKETNYFSFGLSGKPAFTGPLDDSSVNRPTVTSFEEYVADFDARPGCLIGEVCPSYSLDGVAANIHRHNPGAKIVILLREPVARAYSNYQHLVRDGREHGSFESALAAEPERLERGWEWFWGLRRNSLYADVVGEYLRTFGEENVKIVFFEDFVKDQTGHLEAVMAFVGLDPASAREAAFESNRSGVVAGRWRLVHRLLLSEGAVNSALRRVLPERARKRLGALLKRASTVRGEVSAETRARLSAEFSPDLARLRELLGDGTGGWLGDGNVP